MKICTKNLERAIIGNIILTGKGDGYLDSWWIEENSFTDEHAKKAYLAIKWLSDKEIPIDAVTVVHALELYMSEFGGLHVPEEWVYQVANEAPNTGHLESYVELLYKARNDERCEDEV